MSQPRSLLGLLVLILACTDRNAAPPHNSGEQQPTPNETAAPAPSPDIDWTERAEAALARAGRPGAVVVIDLERTDERLIVAEQPGQVESPAYTARSPGSVVKPLLALAALHEQVVRVDETIDCAGPRELDGHTLTCFHDHGPVALADALTTSCNHYAFEIAHRLGMQRLHQHFWEFFRSKTSVVPHAGVASEIGTGHGELAVSPIQIASAYAALATGKPTSGDSWDYTEAELETIRAAMHGVVHDERGTGNSAAVEGLTILGKTGSTETGEGDQRVGLAWFAGWAPAEHPRVVVVVQLEGEGSGGELAAPVAQQLFAALVEPTTKKQAQK